MIHSDFSVFRGKSQKRLGEQLKGVRYKATKLMKFKIIFSLFLFDKGRSQTMLTGSHQNSNYVICAILISSSINSR